MTLASKIDLAIALKQGNKEFALFYDGPDCGWSAEIGNNCAYVRLGENAAELFACGNTPEDAVDALLKKLKDLLA